MSNDSLTHSYVSAELGVALHYGPPLRHFVLSAAFAPTWYKISVDADEDTSDSSIEALNFRFGASIRLGTVLLGSAVNVLSGPTFWLEPVYFGLAF
jgi:hypothetical protein